MTDEKLKRDCGGHQRPFENDRCLKAVCSYISRKKVVEISPVPWCFFRP
ncbi:MAG: hypothetical protein GF398_21345 [Chitinivibrionales bacterium]|nr:hypothetical protein [Chitinivibrionales bacterium]